MPLYIDPVGDVGRTRPGAGALDGIRVLDLSRVLAGPVCTQLLADLGADVIKVERPGVGDETRQWGPPWLTDADGNETRESSYYLSANRGKRSITVDIGQPDGVALLLELARSCDVFVENFKVGALARKGLGYDDVRAVRPDVVYASITGFGQDGPLADQPGYDYLAQAMGGLMSITGRPDGEPGGGPLRAGVAIADQATGMFTAVGILAALRHRDQTGVGQHVDVSLLDSQLAFLVNQGLNYLVGGTPPARSGEWHPNLAPYQPFDVADGRVIVAVGNDRQFAALTTHLGLGELASDPRFATNPDRNEHREALAVLLGEAFARLTTRDVLDALPALGVPAAVVNDIAQAFDEPQVKHRGGEIALPHTSAGSAPGIANPVHFSESPIEYRNAPPLLGEHTSEVLEELLGVDDATVDSWRERGIIG